MTSSPITEEDIVRELVKLSYAFRIYPNKFHANNLAYETAKMFLAMRDQPATDLSIVSAAIHLLSQRHIDLTARAGREPHTPLSVEQAIEQAREILKAAGGKT